jgi:YidC/Oxa1 family membrane protein insertase
MIEIFYLVLTQPLFNLLVFFYDLLPIQDLGLAIILLTFFIKLVLLPLSQKALRSQKALQELQPEIAEIQAKFKGDREKLGRATMKLYQARGINPMGGCLPLLIQLPILIALFDLFRRFESINLDATLYPFIANPGGFSPVFLGLVNLIEPSLVLALIAGLAQFWQSRLMFKIRPKTSIEAKRSELFSHLMGKQMIYVMPALTAFIALSLPSALALYWAVNALFTVGQELYLKRNA